MTTSTYDHDTWRAQQDAIKAAAARHRLYTPFGLMVLNEHLHAAPIRKPLRVMDMTTPSGAQIVPSEEVGELVEQLAFAPGVYDIMVRPRVRYLEGRGEEIEHHPDIVVQLHASDLPHGRLLIDIGPRHDREIEAGHLAAEALGGRHVHLGIDDVRTAYLDNARLLSAHRVDDDDSMTRVLDVVDTWPRHRIPVQQAVELTMSQGSSRMEAEELVMAAAACHLAGFDLTRPFAETNLDPSLRPSAWSHHDTLLRRLAGADA